MTHYWQVVFRSVFRQRWMSTLCIVSISLAVAVTCILISASHGLTKTLIEQVKSVTGDYSIQIMNSGQIAIDNGSIIKEFGHTYASLKEHSVKFGNDMIFAEVDDATLNMLGVEMTSGRYPQTSGEALISEQILKLYGIEKFHPQKIYFSVASKQKEATVVGIYKNHPAYASDTNTAIYLGKNTFREWMIPEAYANTSIMISYYDHVNPITATESIKQQFHLLDKNISYNMPLLQSMGYAAGSDSSGADVVFLVIALILLTAIFFMIYSIFNISVTNRTKQLGMLRAIGTTPNQVGMIVIIEALVLFCIAVPIGWLATYLGIHLILPAVATILPPSRVGVETTAQVENLLRDNTSISVFPLAISAFLGLVISIVSVLFPAIRASKVSPVCALTNETSNDATACIRKGQISSKYLYYKLAFIDQKRNRKRVMVTIISLSIGIIILFAGVGIFPMLDCAWENMSIESDYQLTSLSGNIPNFEDKGIEQQEITQLLRLPGVQKIDPSFFALEISDSKQPIFVIGRSDQVIKEIIKDSKIGITIDEMNDKNYGLLYLPQEYNNEGQSVLQPGDTIKIRGQEIIVAGLIQKLPLQISMELTRPYLLLTKDRYIRLSGNDTVNKIDVFTQENITNTCRAEIEDKMKQLKSQIPDGSFVSALDAKKDIEQSMQRLRFMIWGFTALIVFIAMLNIMNTMFTSIQSRKKEFGMLRAIGITPGELKRMLYTEAFLYGVRATILGGLIGIPLAYTIAILADSKLPALSAIFTNLVLAGLGTTALCFLSTIFPIKYILQKGIIQTIVKVE